MLSSLRYRSLTWPSDAKELPCTELATIHASQNHFVSDLQAGPLHKPSSADLSAWTHTPSVFECHPLERALCANYIRPRKYAPAPGTTLLQRSSGASSSSTGGVLLGGELSRTVGADEPPAAARPPGVRVTSDLAGNVVVEVGGGLENESALGSSLSLTRALSDGYRSPKKQLM